MLVSDQNVALDGEPVDFERRGWRMRQLYGSVALLGAWIGMPRPIAAQDLSILPSDQVQWIKQEVSGDASYEHIRFTTQFHKPGGGADGLWLIAQYVERKAKEYGLDQVQLIKQPGLSGRPLNATLGDLWITSPTPERIASTVQVRLHLADGSRPSDVTGPLVDVGAGAPTDYADVAVAGTAVLTYGAIGTAMREAVGQRGALGVVWYPNPFREQNAAHPDQIQWEGIGGDGDAVEPTFAFVLSLRQGLALRERLRVAASPIIVHAVVKAKRGSIAGDEPWLALVEGFIPGTDPGLEQDVILTAHMQEEKFSADDDGSGTANTLEVARALSRLIAEGHIPRPRRNIRFWWTTEMQSERRYFADHPEEASKLWVDINQDMVGLNQSLGVMGMQNVTRLPATHAHFFNDVVESVVEHMVTTNDGELAQYQVAGSPRPYLDPHLSHLGSRHRYNAKMVYFHLNTDHIAFNETPIRVPGVTFTDWPNDYIHSSDDDLWTMDRTQLGRNAAAAALMAYAMASAGPGNLHALVAETAGRGAVRFSRNHGLAVEWLTTEDDKAAAYRRGVEQLRFTTERERQMVGSLRSINADGVEELVTALLELVALREVEGLKELETLYRAVTGRTSVLPLARVAVEERLAELRPVVVGGPKEFFPKRYDVQRYDVPGLHSLMAFEIVNAINGARSGLDIYQFVAAEAREAGAHYYGVVTPERTLAYLEQLAGTGLVRLAPTR